MSITTAPQVGQAAREGADYMPAPGEVRSGRRWIDGRPIWQTTVLWHTDQGLGGGGTTLAHFIPDLAVVIDVEGFMRVGTSWVPLSRYNPEVSPSNVVLTGAGALTGWITLYFVRTTDPIPIRTD